MTMQYNIEGNYRYGSDDDNNIGCRSFNNEDDEVGTSSKEVNNKDFEDIYLCLTSSSSFNDGVEDDKKLSWGEKDNENDEDLIAWNPTHMLAQFNNNNIDEEESNNAVSAQNNNNPATLDILQEVLDAVEVDTEEMDDNEDYLCTIEDQQQQTNIDEAFDRLDKCMKRTSYTRGLIQNACLSYGHHHSTPNFLLFNNNNSTNNNTSLAERSNYLSDHQLPSSSLLTRKYKSDTFALSNNSTTLPTSGGSFESIGSSCSTSSRNGVAPRRFRKMNKNASFPKPGVRMSMSTRKLILNDLRRK